MPIESQSAATRGVGLRFGVMCKSTTFPDWQAECIARLLQVPSVRPALLIIDDDPPPAKAGLAERLKSPHLLWNLRARMFDGPARIVDMSSELRDVPQMRCRTELRGRFSQYFAREDVGEIENYRLDFILRFAFNIIRGPILSAATYGV